MTLPDLPGESLRLAGIDPLTARGLLGFDPPDGDDNGDLASWLGETNALAVTPEFLAAHGLKRGDGLRLQGPGAPHHLRITHTIGGRQASATGGRVVATDIAINPSTHKSSHKQQGVGRPASRNPVPC